jgi:predicted nucleic acid-binding protein
MPVVSDTSALLGIIFPDEDTTYPAAVFRCIEADQAIVPALFWFELRNALLMGERRKRISSHAITAFLGDLDQFSFEVDHQPREGVVFALARSYSLTIFDAAYLELAQRKNLSLATIDRALQRAATAAGVVLFTAP